MLIVFTGCARQAVRVGPRAPNPNGCYVIVYEQPDFQGAGDVFNGPARWLSLEGLLLTNEQSWQNRIRSVRVGNRATVTMYVNAAFKGESGRFPSNAELPRLDQALSGRIKSLELDCPE